MLDVLFGTLALWAVQMLATCVDAFFIVQAAIQESVANIKTGTDLKA